MEGFLEEEAFVLHLKRGVKIDQKGKESESGQTEEQHEQGCPASSTVAWQGMNTVNVSGA